MSANWAVKVGANEFEITSLIVDDIDEKDLVLDAVESEKRPWQVFSKSIEDVPKESLRVRIGNHMYRVRRSGEGRERCPSYEKCPYEIPKLSSDDPRWKDLSLMKVGVRWKLFGRWGVLCLVDHIDHSLIVFETPDSDAEASEPRDTDYARYMEYWSEILNHSGDYAYRAEPIKLVLAFLWVNNAPAHHAAVGFHIPGENYEFFCLVDVKSSYEFRAWMDAMEMQNEIKSISVDKNTIKQREQRDKSGRL